MNLVSNDTNTKNAADPPVKEQGSKWSMIRGVKMLGTAGMASKLKSQNVASSKKVEKPEPMIPKQAEKYRGKKTLVLDIDDTLVQSVQHKDVNKNVEVDIKLDVTINWKTHCEILVYKRPGVDDFLRELSKHYELIVFTASLEMYAMPLMKQLDKEGICETILHRKHCIMHGTQYTKDLSQLNRGLKDIMIIDNSPHAYVLNPDNALPIKTWSADDRSDT